MFWVWESRKEKSRSSVGTAVRFLGVERDYLAIWPVCSVHQQMAAVDESMKGRQIVWERSSALRLILPS